MNELLENIVCPISKKKLEILIFDFFEFDNQKVRTGILYCKEFKIFYNQTDSRCQFDYLTKFSHRAFLNSI